LIAATLEKSWEQALLELERAQATLASLRAAPRSQPKISAELRASFVHVGRRLPELWPRLSVEAKKSLLRTLIDRVILLRDDEGVAHIRVVWQGGVVTETGVRVPGKSLQYSRTEKDVAERLRELTEQGQYVDQIIATLNGEGRVPCRGGSFVRATDRKDAG
jgi:hypothetical protein